MTLFLRGLLIGLAIAAPVGPIGVLCIRRTLAYGRAVGLVSGLGAATADAVFGAIAGFGLAFVADFLLAQQLWLRLVGGLFLCYLGVKTLLTRPAAAAAPATGSSYLAAYTSTLFLTLTNPVTILSFIAIFAGLGLAAGGSDYRGALTLVAGVFLGSAAWWLLLSGGVSLLRARITPRHLRWINIAAGAIILAFGVVAVGGASG